MVNGNLDDIFNALSDPTRRDMLQRLLNGEHSVNQLAQAYNISLPAVSKHLKVLENAHLVTKERRGRQHFVALTSSTFRDATDHILYYQTTLDKRLDSLDRYLHKGRQALKPDATLKKKSPQQTLTVSHIFDVPCDEVWEAYVNAKQLSKWWERDNIKLTTCYIDARPEGIWRFAFRGADNKEYVVSGQYKEVKPLERLVYTDGFGEAGSARPEALVTVTFETLPDGKTKLTKSSAASRATHQLQAAWLQAAQSA